MWKLYETSPPYGVGTTVVYSELHAKQKLTFRVVNLKLRRYKYLIVDKRYSKSWKERRCRQEKFVIMFEFSSKV